MGTPLLSVASMLPPVEAGEGGLQRLPFVLFGIGGKVGVVDLQSTIIHGYMLPINLTFPPHVQRKYRKGYV